MMTLTTHPVAISSDSHRVYWWTGTKNYGALTVKINEDLQDGSLIAELCAIRFLLFEKKVFKVDPTSGHGYKLVVSSGAIKKLYNGKSQKKQAEPYAAFLSARMQGVTIEVGHPFGPLDHDDPNADIDYCEATATSFRTIAQTVDTPCIGPVVVTLHAIQRFKERGNPGGDEIQKPWASLVRQLQSPALRRIQLADEVLEHKARKYAAQGESEFWSAPDSALRFVIVRNGETRTLVTVFRRSNAYL